MKLFKCSQFATLILVMLFSGCSEEAPKPLNNLQMRNLPPTSGDSWWDISLPKDFDAKTSKGVWLVIRDYHGSIIGHSAVVLSPDMDESVRVIIKSESESDRIIAKVLDLNGTGATVPIVKPDVLDLPETRKSGTTINLGDTLIKWKIKCSSVDEIPNASPLSVIQEGEASLSLEEYQHKD